MSNVTYEVVEHDGGWAYKLADVFSETFPTREDALAAAESAATRQEFPGETETIQYQDEDGKWREENSLGEDRPDVEIEDRSGRAE